MVKCRASSIEHKPKELVARAFPVHASKGIACGYRGGTQAQSWTERHAISNDERKNMGLSVAVNTVLFCHNKQR